MRENPLLEKLKSLGVSLGKDFSPKPQAIKPQPIDQVVQGEFIATPAGEVFCVLKTFPYDHKHGSQPIACKTAMRAINTWANVACDEVLLDKIVFLDTETSGLSGGTGTYAFMVGVGRFTAQGFTLAQFFMRHPAEETALLLGLLDFMHPFQAVVTYNGKSFDIPLLNTRFVMNHLDSPFGDKSHYDLLHLSRRLWRDRLADRSLGEIENKILGVNRSQQEVPGWMIPEMYFEYLRTQNALPLAGIFYHNEIDILSLTGLFSYQANLLEHPLDQHDLASLDMAALAKLFEKLENYELSLKLYEKSMDQGLSDQFFWQTLQRFSYLHKRKGDIGAAIRLWEKAAENAELYAFEELAKYYEHEAKVPAQACEWVSSALNILPEKKMAHFEQKIWQENLNHRLTRLKKKIK